MPPFIPDVPPTGTIQVPTERVLDTFSIDSFKVNFVQNNPMATTIDVAWFEGYMDGADFVPAVQKNARLGGSPLLQAMNAPVPPGASVYNAIRDALWGLMAAQGLVPQGSAR